MAVKQSLKFPKLYRPQRWAPFTNQLTFDAKSGICTPTPFLLCYPFNRCV